MKNENLFVRGLKNGFKNFGHNVTNVVNFILLVPVYFIGVGATSLMAKGFGKKFLELKVRGKTYWKDEKRGTQLKDDYYRQF